MFICVANDDWLVLFDHKGAKPKNNKENEIIRSPRNFESSPYTNHCGECGLEDVALKFDVYHNPRTVVGAISLKSRRGDGVKRKNSIVLPFAVSFAYFFSAKEIGILLM